MYSRMCRSVDLHLRSVLKCNLGSTAVTLSLHVYLVVYYKWPGLYCGFTKVSHPLWSIHKVRSLWSSLRSSLYCDLYTKSGLYPVEVFGGHINKPPNTKNSNKNSIIKSSVIMKVFLNIQQMV